MILKLWKYVAALWPPVWYGSGVICSVYYVNIFTSPPPLPITPVSDGHQSNSCSVFEKWEDIFSKKTNFRATVYKKNLGTLKKFWNIYNVFQKIQILLWLVFLSWFCGFPCLESPNYTWTFEFHVCKYFVLHSYLILGCT